MRSHLLKAVENRILSQIRDDDFPTPIFILSSPRTGSTFCYQTLAETFGLPYFSNLTNEYFPETPIIGLKLQSFLRSSIRFESRYGKTRGLLQPSEASRVMKHWFGSVLPYMPELSATACDNLILQKTIRAGELLFAGRPVLIKNTWNCYRVESILRILPKARFIWLRRDLRAAALSDLLARVATKGSRNCWTSVPPPNKQELSHLAPELQVVENQYIVNNVISASLSKIEPTQWYELWYEDLITDLEVELDNLSKWLGEQRQNQRSITVKLNPNNLSLKYPGEIHRIRDYCQANLFKLAPYYYDYFE